MDKCSPSLPGFEKLAPLEHVDASVFESTLWQLINLITIYATTRLFLDLWSKSVLRESRAF